MLINYVEWNFVIGECKVNVNVLSMKSVIYSPNPIICFYLITKIALRKTILRAHRQAWCWQDEYQGLTLADIRQLEDETQRELNKRMAHFQTQNIHTNSNAENENTQTTSTLSINEINQPLSSKQIRQTSIDNLNANRPRINSFPVPPLPRDEVPDEEYFDAESKSNMNWI